MDRERQHSDSVVNCHVMAQQAQHGAAAQLDEEKDQDEKNIRTGSEDIALLEQLQKCRSCKMAATTGLTHCADV